MGYEMPHVSWRSAAMPCDSGSRCVYLHACMSAREQAPDKRGGGALWAHGAAAAADTDAPCAVAPIVVCAVVQRVKKVALPLPVLLVPACAWNQIGHLPLGNEGQVQGTCYCSPSCRCSRAWPQPTSWRAREAAGSGATRSGRLHGGDAMGRDCAEIAAAVEGLDGSTLAERVALRVVVSGAVVYLKSAQRHAARQRFDAMLRAGT